MNVRSEVVVDFKKLGGPVYSGRSKGELARIKFKLDEVDKAQAKVIVRIPESAYSVTSSFYLALFGKSILHAGSREAFLSRYDFQVPKVFLDTFETCISRALQEHRALISDHRK